VGRTLRPSEFLWTPAAGIQPVSSLPNTQTSSTAGVNDAGQVVGCALLTNNTQAGFLWTSAAGAQDLLSLIPDKKNFIQVWAKLKTSEIMPSS